MFGSFFKIAFRQFFKQKLYSAINIGGFAFSIAACILIALFTRSESDYDRGYPDSDRIFRVTNEYHDNGAVEKGSAAPPPMAKVLKNDFPEIEISGRLLTNRAFWGAGSNYIRRTDQDQNTYEQGFAYADQGFLDIFRFNMIYGSQSEALKRPLSMVISKKIADKYFPGQDPVGKVMMLNDNHSKPYTIGGVIEKMPPDSHLQYDFLLTLAGFENWPGEQSNWTYSNYKTYLLLRPGVSNLTLEKKISSDLLKNYFIPAIVADGTTAAEAQKVSDNFSFHLQPVHDIYLGSVDIHDDMPHGDSRFVWLLGSIACFILIIACINFINLSTARSANRAREVGLRKVLGCRRSGLIRQFLTESILLCFLALVLGVLIAWIFLPNFNRLSAGALSIPWTQWWFFPLLISAAILIGGLSGLYPSFYLSAFNPIQVLKGKLSGMGRNAVLRNGLVIFQFTVSIILIISTMIIYNQMQFILNKKLGFEKDQVVLIEGADVLGRGVGSFKNELLRLPLVKSVSVSDYLPIAGMKRNANNFYTEGKARTESGVLSQFWQVDGDYINTLNMKLVAGRNFSPTIPSDSQAVVINQAMANSLHLKDPCGKRITNGQSVYQVIGVVQDFNFESLRDNIGAVCLQLGSSPGTISIKASTDDMRDLVSAIADKWKQYAPAQPLRYSFLSERFASTYADVQRTSYTFTSFSILAIVISCLGLFALSSYMAEQRMKEMGVRKVLGASVSGITALMSKAFVRLVIISILIASPIAWWAMSKWLQDFAYRISINLWVFILAALVAVGVALLTVGFQAMKVARTNPIKSLRSE
jgi:putative ABC transport system permease protein